MAAYGKLKLLGGVVRKLKALVVNVSKQKDTKQKQRLCSCRMDVRRNDITRCYSLYLFKIKNESTEL